MNIKSFIKNTKRSIAFLISIMMIVALFPTVAVSAESSSNIYTYSDYAVEYNVINEWDCYQNIEIKLTNTGKEPIYNWALGYNAGGEIISIWNSAVYSNSGTDYIIKKILCL